MLNVIIWSVEKEKSCMIIGLSSSRSFMLQQCFPSNGREIISSNIGFGISTTVTYMHYCYHQLCQSKVYIHYMTVQLLRKPILLQDKTCMLISINILSLLFANQSIQVILHAIWLVINIVNWII
jgi:hypothetical protein